MKKFFIAFFVVAALSIAAAFERGGAFAAPGAFSVGNLRRSGSADVPITSNTPATSTTTVYGPTIDVTPLHNRRGEDDSNEREYEDDGYTQTNQSSQPSQTTSTAPSPAPTPAPAPKPAPSTTPSNQSTGKYKDGTYTGSVADAYYGYIQVQAVISGGSITDVVFLRYPNDRQNSIYINEQAMPYLKYEAIQAQSANVNIVSGATDSSIAFRQSLASALNQAL